MSKMNDEGTVPDAFPGFSRAEHFGVAKGTRAAIAGTFGRAILKGFGGVAMAGKFGSAHGGERAVVVSGGPDCWLEAGPGGIAFSPHTALNIRVGDGGLVIATKPVTSVIAGNNAIVVLTDASSVGPLIQVGANSLVIRRWREGSTPVDVLTVIATPGQAGLQDGKPGLMLDNTVVDGDTDPEQYNCALRYQQDEVERWIVYSLDQDFIDSVMSDVPAPAVADRPSAVRDRIDPTSFHRKFILCKALPNWVRFAQGSMFSTKWDANPKSPDGIFGLLWGVGDPTAAGLGYGEDWALVAVPSYVIAGPLDDRGHPSVVKFRAGIVLDRGSNADILRHLVELGVEPERLIGEVKTVGDGDQVEAGTHGVAWAGDRGWAIVGRNGHAEVGENGFAEAGVYGFAKAGAMGIATCEADGTALVGPGGVAISYGGRYGTATAGFEGLAVGDGRFKTVSAGAGGAAVSTSYGGRVTAGEYGVAVGSGDIEAGKYGVAVALNGTLLGDEGCLLVGIICDPEGKRGYVSAMVGRGDYLPNVRYAVQDGMLRPYVETTPP